MSTASAAPSVLPAGWLVELPAFEGPLDLLLQLVRVNKVEIADIPVAQVCDQFHAYLELMEELSLDIAGDYIYMAAYLIHLKSKLLLPRPRTLQGEVVEEDPRQDLVQRLLEYRRLKEAASVLAEVDSVRRGMVARKSDELRTIAKADPASFDLGELSLFDLLRSFRSVLERFQQEHPDPLQIRGEMFSVRDQVERLLALLERSRPFDLLDDLRQLSGRREAVAAFLAVLELARLNLVRLHQTATGSVLLYRTTKTVADEELEGVAS